MAVKLGSGVGAGTWNDGDILYAGSLNDTLDHVWRLSGSRVEIIHFDNIDVKWGTPGTDDTFTAKTYSNIDSKYSGIIAFALGCNITSAGQERFKLTLGSSDEVVLLKYNEISNTPQNATLIGMNNSYDFSQGNADVKVLVNRSSGGASGSVVAFGIIGLVTDHTS